MPSSPPVLPESLLERITVELNANEAPFATYLSQSLNLKWLEPADDRLGCTRFEMAPAELSRRKRLKSPPGDVTIYLHPILIDDEDLMNHTLVHELLHAAGITEHNSRHHELIDSIAPPPKLSDSLVLQYLQAGVIASTEQLSWECSHCDYVWVRNQVRKPKSCPSCARNL